MLSDRRLGDALFCLERFARAFRERRAGWQDDGNGADFLMGGIAARGQHPLRGEFLRRFHEAMARHDDAVVGGDQVLLRPVLDRPHAFLEGRVLHADSLDAAERVAGLLRRAVDEVVVVPVLQRTESEREHLHVDALAVLHRMAFVGGEGAHRMVVEAPRPAIVIVDRDPEVAVHRVIAARRDHGEAGHDPRRDAPVVVAVLGVASRADVQAALALDHLEHRLLVLEVVLVALRALEKRIRIEAAAMQEGHVARVDPAFHRLQVIALLQALRGVALFRRNCREFPFGQRRLLVRRAHVGPEHAAALDQRIGLELDLGAETAFLGLGGNLDALARHVVLPAVIRAAQPVFLVASVEERYAAVRAEFVDKAELAAAVSKRNQPL